EGERARIESFHQRLETPIERSEFGSEEGGASAVFSPFRVVGVSIFLIGLMMVALLPWLYQTDAFALDLFFGVVLIGVGASSYLLSARKT
ncbi:MAG: hypothetical protein KC917_17290, partial [Candidatus Omnitrophica bacterium]|nr:hypothetical protein [Candidatus Omnitrophota bacterium]